MADFSAASRLGNWLGSVGVSEEQKARAGAVNTGGGPPSIADYARAEAVAARRPMAAQAPMTFGAEYGRLPGRASRPPPHFQRRTLIDTFVDRDDFYWQTRVTLKIDVPFTDHSHIIGRQGKNTQKVMKETQCHIHFPDSNKNNDMDKSNQVSIAGPPGMVEQARHRIRDLAPLTVTFELKDIRPDVNLSSLANHPALETVTGIEGLHVLVRHNRSSGQPFALIRGSVYQAQLIKQAALNLMSLVFVPGTSVLCSTSLEILQPQQDLVKGPGNIHIQAISQRTGAAIHFPDVARTGATSFFIQGTLDAILQARHHIIGCLPIYALFELDMDQPGQRLALPTLEAEYNCSLTVKVKKGLDGKNAVIRTAEANLSSAYDFRRDLLLSGNGPKTSAVSSEAPVKCHDYNFMHGILVPIYHLHSEPMPAPPMHPQVPSQHVPYMPLQHNLMPPFVPHHFNNASLDNSSGHPPTAVSTSLCSSASVANLTVNAGDCALPPPHTPVPPSSPMPHAPHPTPSNPDAPRTPRVNLADQLDQLAPDAVDSPIAASIVNSAVTVAHCGEDKRAPGSGRRIRFTSNYEDLKLQATRQMASCPEGIRYPSDAFSGYGFSKTFNDSRLRAARAAAAPAGLDRTAFPALAALDEDAKLHSDTDTVEDSTSGEARDGGSDGLGSPVLRPRKVRGFAETAHFDSGLSGRSGGLDIAAVEEALDCSSDLAEILSRLKLTKWVECFAEEEVDLDTFLTVDEEELRDMGVTTIGARHKLLTLQKFIKQILLHRQQQGGH